MNRRTYKINEVARLAGVSVRTLHHYDHIELLTPSHRSAAGYRLYTDADLLRLQQILIGRALGLALEDVRALLDDPSLDRRELLARQRAQLIERVRTTDAMIRSIDTAIALLNERDCGSTTMNMKDIFDGFDPAEYEPEARTRWGHTGSYRESLRRTQRYSSEDWHQFKAENRAVMSDAAAALGEQRAPDDPGVLDIAERHRLLIDRWFYPCSRQMHAGLADLYEADERFAHSIDRFGAGLTPFLSAAIRANARRGPEAPEE
jgi:DNA-binding transcriptional MerR regulator